MRVLHIAPLDGNRGSGLNRSIPALVRAQRKKGASVKILGTGAEVDLPDLNDLNVHFWSRLSKDDVRKLVEHADIAVFHSTYIPVHATIAKYLNAAPVPYLITPRGGMTKAAGSIKPLKKLLGNALFFKRLVRGAKALHFLTEGEAAASENWKKHYFVVGNGIDPAPGSLKRNVYACGPMKFIFIGRLAIHHKGLDLLIEAWAAFKKKFSDLHSVLHIYGPDHEGGRSWLEDAVKRFNIEASVRIEGPTYGHEKEAVFQDAAAFLHTSRFEGCPMAVLEALVHGVPCILTPGTFMAEEIARAGAGLRVEANSQGIAGAISAVANQECDLAEMSCAASVWAGQRSWPAVAQATLEEYEKLLKG